MKPKISILVAVSKNGVIGKNGKLPWHISEDIKRFKALTTGHPIIMGRKTWESIGSKPLPNRANVIVTRDKKFKAEGGEVAHSVEEAIELAKKVEKEEIFIIGGGEIYKLALPLTDRIYLTLVYKEVDGDTFFPDYSDFKKVISEEEKSDGELSYKFLTLEK